MNQFASEPSLSAVSAFQRQEISRVLTAAVINEKFRNLLLANPDQALAKGYRGEPFQMRCVSNAVSPTEAPPKDTTAFASVAHRAGAWSARVTKRY